MVSQRCFPSAASGSPQGHSSPAMLELASHKAAEARQVGLSEPASRAHIQKAVGSWLGAPRELTAQVVIRMWHSRAMTPTTMVTHCIDGRPDRPRGPAIGHIPPIAKAPASGSLQGHSSPQLLELASIKATKGKPCFEMASKVTVMMFAVVVMVMAGQLACSSQ